MSRKTLESPGRRQFVARAGALLAAVPVAGVGLCTLLGCGSRGAPVSLASATPAPPEPDLKSLTWRTKIVGDDEPGEPLLVAGRIFAADGRTPLEGVRLYFYHTDARGIYSERDGEGPPDPRIKGWLKTDAEGRYEFRTIKPASYPNSRIPAHVHAKATPPGGAEQWIEEFWFEGDPHLGAQAIAAARAAGQFSNIMAIRRGPDRVLNCARDIRLKDA
ncbi:MAG TPA: hypothetical protein VER32_03300 [Pyrinomonadaceae bacterium]|nr:hypothetical protein [Pyrinomonadaceae bacterium]